MVFNLAMSISLMGETPCINAICPWAEVASSATPKIESIVSKRARRTLAVLLGEMLGAPRLTSAMVDSMLRMELLAPLMHG